MPYGDTLRFGAYSRWTVARIDLTVVTSNRYHVDARSRRVTCMLGTYFRQI